MHAHERSARKLLDNRRRAEQIHGVEELRHTPPSPEHYLHKYLWDSGFFIIMYAEAGRQLVAEGRYEEAAEFRHYAQEELMAVLEGQQSSGMIPNVQFIKQDRSWDFERLFALDQEASCSNYTQPPVLALSAMEVFTAGIEAGDFEAYGQLEASYPKLKDFFGYLENERSNDGQDRLIGVIHPHETGRDSDPTFDFIKKLRLPRSGPETSRYVDLANTAIDYGSIIWHGIKLKRQGQGDIAKMREIFWVNDVMMNCIYVDNLRRMSELAHAVWQPDDARHFVALAHQVEQQIIDKMWDPDAREGKGAFYALGANGQKIEEISISNLFPLALKSLRAEQLESLLTLMDESFNTPYPLPSVATDSPNYDPHNNEHERLWRGPVWNNTNWYLVRRGLHLQADREDLPPVLRQRCEEWAEHIADKSEEALEKFGQAEHRSPIDGRPQRTRVKDFGWDLLGYFMRRRK